MRVQINAGGREVVIDCADTNVNVKDIAHEALVIWQCTEGVKAPSDGPAFGLAASEIGTDRPATSAMMPAMEVAR